MIHSGIFCLVQIIFIPSNNDGASPRTSHSLERLNNSWTYAGRLSCLWAWSEPKSGPWLVYMVDGNGNKNGMGMWMPASWRFLGRLVNMMGSRQQLAESETEIENYLRK